MDHEAVVELPKSPVPGLAPAKPLPSTQEKMWSSFAARKYEVKKRPAPIAARANTAPNEHYTLEFLTHVRVFIYAKEWDVKGLAALAIQRLHETLTKFTLYEERVGDVSKLVEYAYSEACAGKIGSGELQDLVVHYAACNIAKLLEDLCFQAVLRAENTASVNLTRKLVEHML